MNKQYLPFFAAFLIVLLVLSQGAIAADDKNKDKTGHPVVGHFYNVTPSYAHIMIETSALVPGNRLFILDVRSPAEYNYGYIEGAVSMPVNKNSTLHDPIDVPDEAMLKWHIDNHKGLPKDKDTMIIVYCKQGTRSLKASQMLVDAGYRKVFNMQGGIDTWVNKKYPVVFFNKWAVYYPSTKSIIV